MSNNECIFCKIVGKEIPAAIVLENDEFLSILDINPNTKGATLVLSKKHYPSYPYGAPTEVLNNMMEASKSTSQLLEKAFKVERTALVIEGTGIDHLHIHLYPIHECVTPDTTRVFFDKYPGYITTQLGPQEDFSKLKDLADFIRGFGD